MVKFIINNINILQLPPLVAIIVTTSYRELIFNSISRRNVDIEANCRFKFRASQCAQVQKRASAVRCPHYAADELSHSRQSRTRSSMISWKCDCLTEGISMFCPRFSKRNDRSIDWLPFLDRKSARKSARHQCYLVKGVNRKVRSCPFN